MHERRENAGAAGANRMAQGDGAAVHVHLCRVEAKFTHDRDRLCRERLVQLE